MRVRIPSTTPEQCQVSLGSYGSERLSSSVQNTTTKPFMENRLRAVDASDSASGKVLMRIDKARHTEHEEESKSDGVRNLHLMPN
jgi:hypothetical protein